MTLASIGEDSSQMRSIGWSWYIVFTSHKFFDAD
jgi:hypothetical protein